MQNILDGEKNMIFDTIIEYGKANGKYMAFKPGDKKRYPHLNLSLEYNPEIDNYTSLDINHNAREFLEKDIVIRELMIPSARKLFIKDMLSIPYSDEERLIGDSAVNQQKKNFKNTVQFFPRFMGLNTDCLD